MSSQNICPTVSKRCTPCWPPPTNYCAPCTVIHPLIHTADEFRTRKVDELETDDELDWPPDFDKMIARGERQERKRLKKEGTLQQQRSHELRILCKEKAKPIRFELSMEEQRKTANFSSALRNFKRLSKLIKTEWEQS